MGSLAAAIAQHGYAVLFGVVICEAMGLPVPAAIALLLAGGASAGGPMHPARALLTAEGALLTGDLLMYTLGRFTGWWLLSLLCRISLNPEACILRSASLFYKRGRAVLIFAKFVPGINTLGPPMAGSMNMRLGEFLAWDAMGATLYATVYWTAGYLFSDFLGRLIDGYVAFGHVVGWVIGIGVAAYFGYQAWVWYAASRRSPVTMISPKEAFRRQPEASIFDARSHGYYDQDTTRIAGSRRLEPNSLDQGELELPRDREIILYCTCAREATSGGVARVLAERGYKVSVIQGGLRAWKKAGLPLEPVPAEDVVFLPRFG
jgi:membrane protein DedA with SNARE-associated domain